MRNKKIILAGGTGFIGQALAAHWGKDNRVVILSRQRANARNNSYGQKLLDARDGYHITYWHWDGRRVERHWADELEGCDLVRSGLFDACRRPQECENATALAGRRRISLDEIGRAHV